MDFFKLLLCVFFHLHLVEIISCIRLGANFTGFPMKDYVVTSTYIGKFKRNRVKRSESNCTLVGLQTSSKSYELCLYFKNTSDTIVSEDARIMFFNGNTNKGFVKLSDLNLDIPFVTGYVLSDPDSSSISGYVENDGFYGRVIVNSKVYYVENVEYYTAVLNNETVNVKSNNAIVYEGSEQNLAVNVYFKNDSIHTYNQSMLLKVPPNENYNNKIKQPKGYLCNVMAIIDLSFLEHVANMNVHTAMAIVISAIENAETLFRSTDFDGDGIPDNIGIQLSTFVIEGTGQDFGISEYILPYSRQPIDGKLYLTKISKFPYLPFHCLGIGFTAQPFVNRVIGLSYTAVMEVTEEYILTSGGICDVQNIFGECHNTLVVTFILETGMRAPQFLTDISLIHELGHSFGSEHDLTFECIDHIMTSHTYKPTNVETFSFSKCSTQQMMTIMKIRAGCFEITEEPFCGNGIVETGEQCDCGHPVYCKQLDQCCVPRSVKSLECKVNTLMGYECHPTQGLCCLGNCKYRNISHINLDCKNVHSTCPCKVPEQKCTCGLLGACLEDECHSLECVRIGLKECPCSKSIQKCQTCCMLNEESCLPSIEITKTMKLEDENLVYETAGQYEELEKISGYHWRDPVENVCGKIGCLKLHFKEFQNGDFCLQKGKLSNCIENRCSLPDATVINVFPDVRIKHNHENQSLAYSTYQRKFILRSILIALLYTFLF